MNLKKILFVISVSVLSFSFVFCRGIAEDKVPELLVFYSATCHKCHQARSEFIPRLEKEFQGKLMVVYRDMADIENYKLLLSLKEKANAQYAISAPVFYLNGYLLNGDQANEITLRNFIISALKNTGITFQEEPKKNLLSYFESFTPVIIINAGLIDGINPCAFTVIVFFISYLAVQGYRKKALIAIGLSFIFAVFLTYLLLGVGFFSFLYQFKGFWLFIKIVNYTVGVFSVILGFVCIWDFFLFKRTNNSEGLILQLPNSIKRQIHKVIGMHYRVDTKKEEAVSARSFTRLIISAFISGFLVSLLEAVCTGQTYLPTIIFVLKSTDIKIKAFAYLLLYNMMFIIPLCVIFLFALFGVTSMQFSNYLKAHMLKIKIAMAALFFGLGIFLLWRG